MSDPTDPPSDDSQPQGHQESRVPSGRLSRFLQIGATAGRMAAGGAAEKLRRAAGKVRDEEYHSLLTAGNARLLAQRLARLRGAAMKVGQMLSLEGDNMLPREFAEALEVLRSSAHHMPTSQVREVLEREYGRAWARRFRSIELKPMASASIGQVHSAFTHDGERIVLKVQYPGVAESIGSDVDNLRSLLALTRLMPADFDLDALTAEVKRQLAEEVDYELELRKLEQYRRALGNRSEFRLPASHPELSTKRILALEHVPGQPLLDWAKQGTQEQRDRAGRLLIELLLLELFQFGLMQTDPNPANYFYDASEQRLVLLDFGAAREVSPAVSSLYRNAFIGIARRDREQLRQVIADLGVHSEQAPEATEILVDIALHASEAFAEGPYDFRASNLQARLKEKGRELTRYQKQLRPPPPEYMFFQRKLGGTYLLCRQLGARVDCGALLAKAGLL